MTIVKRGFKIQMGLEMFAALLPGAPQQKSHYEPVVPTAEQEEQRRRAIAALKELEGNPFVEWPRMDEDIEIRPLKTRQLVFDETHEQYMERLQAWWNDRKEG